MKHYYIYHIPGVKIGCTKKPKNRVREQGYSEYEVLEVHTDKNIAAEREIELQKQYGYKVDAIKYNQTDYESLGKRAGTNNVKLGRMGIIGKAYNERMKIKLSAYKKETNEYVGTYESMHECARELNLKVGDIWQCLSPNRRQKSTKGYSFTKEQK